MPNCFGLIEFFEIPAAIRELPLNEIVPFIMETSRGWANVSEREQKAKPRSKQNQHILNMDDSCNRLRFFFEDSRVTAGHTPKVTNTEFPVFAAIIDVMKEKGLDPSDYARLMQRLRNSERS